MNIKGFAIQKGMLNNKEQKTAQMYAIVNDIPFVFIKNINSPIPEGFIPVGSVEWTLKLLNKNITPDYYPEFLKEWLHRKVWKSKWPLKKDVFVKPADRYKRFTGFVTKTNGYAGKKRGILWCSEVVTFVDEWRYYVCNGKVLTAEWYWNNKLETEGEPLPAPELDIRWPEGWCGAADFGSLPDGKIALIEAQHPFAIGWYGDSSKDKLYLEFLVEGWKYVQREKDIL